MHARYINFIHVCVCVCVCVCVYVCVCACVSLFTTHPYSPTVPKFSVSFKVRQYKRVSFTKQESRKATYSHLHGGMQLLAVERFLVNHRKVC